MNIVHITHNEIDKHKWDECISKSPGSLIYATSFYLDNISPGWEALVLNDYEALMPLTWKKKWGFHYLYQPHFTPALGVFGKSTAPHEFLKAVPARFRYCDIDLNENNASVIENRLAKTRITLRINQMLDLNNSYAIIRSGYKRLAVRMIRKAMDNALEIERNVAPEQIIGLYKKWYHIKQPGIPDSAFHQLLQCANIAYKAGNAFTYLATTPAGNEAAVYLIFADERFVYSVIGGSTDEGQEMGAFYLLTDAAIKDNCASARTFRFEGSDIPGIQFFNAQFGSVINHYPHVITNKLPFPFNIFK